MLDEMHQLLHDGLHGIDQISEIVINLKNFSRLDRARVSEFSVQAGLESTLLLAKNVLKNRVEIRKEYGANVPQITCSPSQINQVFLNIITNAVDAMPQGKPGVITLRTARQGKDMVRVEIQDNGSGIPKDVLAKIFDPFFTTKAVGKGTGLGLSQIFGFAHQSGGEVGIESEVGRGTTVSIYLPRTDAEASNVRTHPAMKARTEDEMTVPGARILLVEDDPRVRTATVGALEDLGYDPVACASGAEALALFDSVEFDIVISDVIMPEMTGPELVRELKARRNDIAVLFVTGYVGEGESDDLVGYDLLRKPFTVSTLASAVATAIARRPSESRPIGGAAAAG